MKLTGIHIKNFKAIHEMKIDSIENALILVGQNNTGKTTILEAIRASFGDYHISAEDFDGDCANIEMDLSLEFSIEDLKWLQHHLLHCLSLCLRLFPVLQKNCSRHSLQDQASLFRPSK